MHWKRSRKKCYERVAYPNLFYDEALAKGDIPTLTWRRTGLCARPFKADSHGVLHAKCRQSYETRISLQYALPHAYVKTERFKQLCVPFALLHCYIAHEL